MALQSLAQEGNPVMKSIYQHPNLLLAMGNGSSKPLLLVVHMGSNYTQPCFH